jgi:copper(I)-binding protein
MAAILTRRSMLQLLGGLPAAAAAVPAALAQEINSWTAGSITVSIPWARAARAGSDTLAFFKVNNAGASEMLVSASTAVARSVEIVGLVNQGGKITTQSIGPTIELPPGQMLFDPGGLGLALRGLTRDLVMGADFDLTLTFQKAGRLTVPVGITAPNAMFSDDDPSVHL